MRALGKKSVNLCGLLNKIPGLSLDRQGVGGLRMEALTDAFETVMSNCTKSLFAGGLITANAYCLLFLLLFSNG